MFHQPPYLHQLLHLLNKKPLSEAELAESRDRIWLSIAAGIGRESNLPSMSPLFWKLRPVYWYGLSLILLASVGMAVYPRYHHLPMPVYQSVALNQATPSPTAFPVSPSASLPVTGLATALPTTQPTQSPSTQSTQSSTLSSPSPSPVSTPNSLSRIQLASTLSDFSQTHTATAATGIRNPNDTVSFLDLLIPRAKADNGVYGTRAYPAVYFADSNSIKEINVYTGETRTILSEPNPILVVTFSSAYQTLIYTTNANDSRSYPPVAVRSYNLNTGQKTTVGTTYMHSGKLSPSGTEFAYFQTTADNPSNGQALLAYHLDDRTTQTITAQSTIGLPTYYQSEFSWSDDNTLVVDQFTYRGVNSDKNLDGQILAKKINLSHPDTAILISDRSPIMFYSSLLVHNRLFTNTYDMAESMNYDYINGQPPKLSQPGDTSFGWLSYVDLSSNTLVDLRSQTGDFLKEWIVNNDATKIVYSHRLPGKTPGSFNPPTLSVIDLATKQVTDLPTEGYNFNLIGWNGNENNVVIQSGSYFYNVDILNRIFTPITH